MQAVHRLEPHKPQNDLPALFHGVFGEFLHQRRVRFFGIFDVLETQRGSIDEQFDQLGPLLRFGGVQDDALDSDGLIELVCVWGGARPL
jgi:hypothetical protein